MQFEQYQLIYAKRHHIPVDKVASIHQLDFAAFLEYQAGIGMLTLPDARRKYVEEYPESFRPPVGRTIKYWTGEYYQDDKYALGSVINLIKPYEDSIREVKNIIA